MRILLTGPGGFLGSALTKYWAARGYELWLLARPSSRLSRLPDLPGSVRVHRPSTPDEIVAVVREARPNVIVHTACAYGRNGETSLDVLTSNMVFGATLIQAVMDTSPSIAQLSFVNTGTVLSPAVSLYALSKTQFSAWGKTIAAQHPDRLRFIDIRLQQMYGPGDDSSKFTAYVIEACRRNEPRLALTAGEQRRDFIYIDDAVNAYDHILAHHNELGSVETIDVGSGEAVSMRSFVELVRKISGASTTLDFGAVPYRHAEDMYCVANNKRLRELGWSRHVSLEHGLQRVLMPHSVAG